MREKIVAVIALSMLVMVVLSVQPVRAQKTSLLIGFSMPLNFPEPIPTTALMHHLYYFMIIDDYNAMGGLNVPPYGKLPIEYIMLVDDYTDAQTYANYVSLVDDYQVDLLFAPWSTARNVYMLPFFESRQFPVVGLTVGSNTLQDLLLNGTSNYFFVVLGQPREDAAQLVEVFNLINDKVTDPDLKIDTVGIGYRDDEHGIEHAEAIRAGLEAAGIQVPEEAYLSYTWYAPPADWSPYISAFEATYNGKDVDVVIMCGYTEVGDFLRACIPNHDWKGIIIGPGLETPMVVYDVLGFTPGQFAGLFYYNGFPACAFDTGEWSSWANVKHREYTQGAVPPYGYLPFPASADFYLGLEALFQAVENLGLDRPAIRDALEFWTFNLTLGGWLSTPISFKFRRGYSPILGNHGTTTQWQGDQMMDVIWPKTAASTESIIYPKFPWSWAGMPDITRDGVIDVTDVSTAAKAFGTYLGHPKYNFRADWTSQLIPDPEQRDYVVDVSDVSAIAKKFGSFATFGGLVSLDP